MGKFHSINLNPLTILSVVTVKESKEEFRRQFRRSLMKRVQKGFSIEECFGLVWEGTLEKTRLPESEHAKLYEELIAWAKQLTPKL